MWQSGIVVWEFIKSTMVTPQILGHIISLYEYIPIWRIDGTHDLNFCLHEGLSPLLLDSTIWCQWFHVGAQAADRFFWSIRKGSWNNSQDAMDIRLPLKSGLRAFVCWASDLEWHHKSRKSLMTFSNCFDSFRWVLGAWILSKFDVCETNVHHFRFEADYNE